MMAVSAQINTTALDCNLTSVTYSLRAMARASSGRLWISYWSGVTGLLYAAYSDDDGASWTEETVEGVSQSSFLGLTLMIDSSDVPHIIYSFEGAVNDQIRYRDRSGGSWSASTIVHTFSGHNQDTVRACIDSSDDIHVVVRESIAGSVLHYYKKLSGVWQAREAVNATGNIGDIAIDSAGDVYLVYYDSDGYLYLKKRNGSWGSAEQVSTNWAGTPGNIVIVSIATDSNDDLHVAFTIDNDVTFNADVHYRKRANEVWLTEQEIKAAAEGSWDMYVPILVLDDADLAYVIYQDNYAPLYHVYYKTVTNGITVGAEVLLAERERLNGRTSLYAGLWQRYPTSSIVPAETQPVVALGKDIDVPTIELWFEGSLDAWPSIIPSSKDSIFLLNDTGDVERELTPYIMSVDGLPGPRELTDVTPLTVGGHVFIPKFESCVFTLSLHWSEDVLVGPDTVIGLLREHGSAMTFKYGPRGNGTGYVKYSGTCWVRRFDILSRVGNQVTAGCELQVEGQVSRGTF